MKKLLSGLLVLICAFCVFLTGCSSSVLKEIKISGKQVLTDDLYDWIYERQDTYLEQDSKGEQGKHWYDINIEMKMQASGGFSASSNIALSFIGKMGFEVTEGPTVNLFYDLKLKMKVESGSTNGNGEESKESSNIEGSLIIVDDVAYADLTAETKSQGIESKESRKVKGDMSDIIGIDLSLEDLIGVDGSDGGLYGIDLLYFLDNAESKSKFYRDGDVIYISTNETEVKAGTQFTAVGQYKFTYARNSAKIQEERVYVKETISSTNSSELIEITVGGLVKSINPTTINIPADADDYLQI